MTFLRLCRNHFVKMAADDSGKCTKIKDVREFMLECVAMLIATKTVSKFRDVFSAICVTFGSEFQDSAFKEALNVLKKEAKEVKAVVKGSSVGLCEENLNTVEKEMKVMDWPENSPEMEMYGSVKSSPFRPFFREVYNERKREIESRESLNSIDLPVNELCCPKFMEILLEKYMPITPLWADAFNVKGFGASSNATAEKWFDKVKNEILEGETFLKVGRFVCSAMEPRVRGICKELSLGLDEATLRVTNRAYKKLYKKDRPEIRGNIPSQNDKDVQSPLLIPSQSLNPPEPAASQQLVTQNENNPVVANENVQCDDTLKDFEKPQNPENDFDNALAEEAWNKRKPRRKSSKFQFEKVISRGVVLSEEVNSEDPTEPDLEILGDFLEEPNVDQPGDQSSSCTSDVGWRFKDKDPTSLMYLYSSESRPVHWGDFFTLYGLAWLSSVIIDACLHEILNRDTKGNEYVAAKARVESSDRTNIFTDDFMFNELNLGGREMVFVPFNVDKHWVLGFFNFQAREYSFLDPQLPEGVSQDGRTNKYWDMFKRRLVNVRESVVRSNVKNWKHKSMQCIQQTDNGNCGVFIIHYVATIVNGGTLSAEFSPTAFREELRGLCEAAYDRYNHNRNEKYQSCDSAAGFGNSRILSNGLFADVDYYKRDVGQQFVVSVLDIAINDEKRRVLKVWDEDLRILVETTRKLTNSVIDVSIQAITISLFGDKLNQNFLIMTCEESYFCLFRRSFNCKFRVLQEDLNGKVLLMPYNADNNHWCLLVANVDERTLVNMNPLPGTFAQFDKFILDKFCSFVEKYNCSSEFYLGETSDWTMKPFDSYPRQKDGISCGVFVIKYVEYHLREEVSRITEETEFNPHLFRKKNS